VIAVMDRCPSTREFIHMQAQAAPAVTRSREAGLPMPHDVHPWNAPGQDVGLVIDRDRQFVQMLRHYRESGGLARGDEVVERLTQCGGRGVPTLARQIVERSVLSFEWRGELWLPMFQFERTDMALKAGPQQVASELASAFDAWNTAFWFVQPNPWLKGRMPVDVINTELAEVIQAARTDRFVAAG
jgi:hypothetical protein